MENLIPVIIFIVIVVVQILRRVAEYKNNRPTKNEDSGGWDDGGWTPATPHAKPTHAPPNPQQPQPSGRVTSILEQLKQQIEEQITPQPVTPTPPTTTSPAGNSQTKRKYISEQALEKRPVDTPVPEEKALPQPQNELMQKTFATAFPQAMKLARQAKPSTRQTIILNARGRRNARIGILMSEVLGPPRSYDV